MINEIDLPASRLGSLYKDFRDLKDLNPEGYQANINTWKKYFVKHILNDKNNLSIKCGKSLLHKLSIDVYGEPKSIDMVLDNFISENILIPSETFFDTKGTDIYSNDSKNVSLLTKLFSLLGIDNKKGYTTRSDVDKDSYLKDVNLIIGDNVKASALMIATNIQSNIINKASEPSDFVLSRSSFLSKSGISEQWDDKYNQDIVIFYLQHYSKIITSNNDVIKVYQTSTKTGETGTETAVTDTDTAIVDIKNTLLLLNRQTEKLENDITRFENKLQSKVLKSLSMKVQKNLIRNKILSQRHLEKLYGNQDNLNDMLRQLNISIANKTMFNTLQQSHEAIKSINTYIGTVDRVTDLLDSIESENEKIAELNDLLSSSNDVTNKIAEEDIDDELAKLVQKMATEEKRNGTSVKESTPTEDESALLQRLQNVRISETNSQVIKEDKTSTTQEKVAEPAV